mmetsp:Transcript_16381/g.25325  ORF Transcript_16381/g.25325 Transcript_16381/m.25325 type:complete len:144 (-) Transcript_16381:22-453(-)
MNAHSMAKAIWKRRLQDHMTPDLDSPEKKPARSPNSPVRYRPPSPPRYERKERPILMPSSHESPLMKPSRDSSTPDEHDLVRKQEIAQFQLKMMKHQMLQLTRARIEQARQLSPEQKAKLKRRAIKELINELELARVLRNSTK